MDKRLQIKLREGIDFKIKEGFEVIKREPYVVLQRGCIKVGVIQIGDTIVVRTE